MTTSPFPTVELFENSGLESASETQFLAVAEELKLAEYAKQVATEVVDCPTAIDIIGSIAPVRALGQIALRYKPSMGSLADCLIDATRQWAMQLGRMHGQECLPMASMTFGEALQEEAKLMAAPTKETESTPRPADPLNAFRRFFNETGTAFADQADELRVRMVFGSVACECYVVRRELAVSLFIYLPVYIPVQRQGDVAQALAWANWQSSFGAFEMDFADGQVRFHYSLPLIGPITDEHARMMFGVCSAAMRRYIVAICQIALTDYDPHGVMIRAKERDKEEQKLMQELKQAEAA